MLPETPAIFALIKEAGNIDDAEMYRVFNMGVGFVVIVAPEDVEGTLSTIGARGYDALRIGHVTDEVGRVAIEPAGLIGGLSDGESSFETAL
jgi:phosphoribosylformylglycinamidine cyclo-ligase